MILIVGHYRSGTSACAGVLHNLGVDMGGHFAPPDEWNAKGNFVDQGMHHALQCHDAAMLREALANRQEPWGIKDHALFDWPEALDMFPDPKVILCIRPSDLSVDSYRERVKANYDADQAKAEHARVRSKIAALLLTPKLRAAPKLTVNMAELNNALAYVTKLAAFVGLPANQAAVDFIDPTLIRFS